MIWALIQGSAAEHPLVVGGVTLVGVNRETLTKVLATLVLIIAIVLLSRGARALMRVLLRGSSHERGYFWGRQVIRLLATLILTLGVLSIWFDDPTRLATAVGLVTAGIAIALQRVITSFAAYLIILRGRIFNVGDRITIGGVRGDVVALDFMQTTVMEMGESPDEQGDAPSMWVHGRQYTGRLVRVSNDKLFDNPIYNFTREFQFVWEEMRVPISYKDDRGAAEQILLDVARRHTEHRVEEAAAAFARLRERYRSVRDDELWPRVFYRLTDNWVELSLRFVVDADGARGVKDAMSREILSALEAKQIGIASSTFEIVGLPPLRIDREGAV
ncbi:MAG TPA: mechanosensitive ion channel domain-containing protein, partial [Casimicrobiaceae bacterium]|nr:mechanosensitive ion channel domain-containing protein [Casimicrobiaceae bacterium]